MKKGLISMPNEKWAKGLMAGDIIDTIIVGSGEKEQGYRLEAIREITPDGFVRIDGALFDQAGWEKPWGAWLIVDNRAKIAVPHEIMGRVLEVSKKLKDESER